MVRFYLKHVERRPDPEPVKVNPKRAIVVGLALWSVALLALFIAPDALPLEKTLAFSTCGVGIVLGFWGLWHVRNR